MTHISVRPEQGIDRQGFRVIECDVEPEPHRNELLVALACLLGGVVLSLLIGLAMWAWTPTQECYSTQEAIADLEAAHAEGRWIERRLCP